MGQLDYSSSDLQQPACLDSFGLEQIPYFLAPLWWLGLYEVKPSERHFESHNTCIDALTPCLSLLIFLSLSSLNLTVSLRPHTLC